MQEGAYKYLWSVPSPLKNLLEPEIQWLCKTAEDTVRKQARQEGSSKFKPKSPVTWSGNCRPDRVGLLFCDSDVWLSFLVGLVLSVLCGYASKHPSLLMTTGVSLCVNETLLESTTRPQGCRAVHWSSNLLNGTLMASESSFSFPNAYLNQAMVYGLENLMSLQLCYYI